MLPALLLDMLKETEKLRDNVEARRKALQAQLAKIKADTRSAAADEQKRIQNKLSELERALGDGWDHLTEATAAKLNQWLKN